MHKAIIPTIEGLALFGCAVFGVLWINDPSGPYEPPFAVFGLVLVAAEIYRRYRGKDKETSIASLEGKLDQLSVGLDSEKNMRAVNFLSEDGYGNAHYKDFLLWAFPNIEKAIISIFKSSSFDDLCKNNNITLTIIDNDKDQELFVKIKSDVKTGYSFWSGVSYFYGTDKKTFGAYFADNEITLNENAIMDFRRLHVLFTDYVNDTLSPDVIDDEISPSGMIPPNY